MKRHYQATKLKVRADRNETDFSTDSVFASLSPYMISKISGELTRVMMEAAQQYLYERSLSELQRSFNATAFADKNPSYQDFSDNTKNDTT